MGKGKDERAWEIELVIQYFERPFRLRAHGPQRYGGGLKAPIQWDVKDKAAAFWGIRIKPARSRRRKTFHTLLTNVAPTDRRVRARERTTTRPQTH